MSQLAFIRAYIDKNVIPIKSVGQSLRGCSQELHVYVKIGQRQDDPLQSWGTLHPVSFLKSIENPTKIRLTYLQSRRKLAQKCEITNCVSRDWPPWDKNSRKSLNIQAPLTSCPCILNWRFLRICHQCQNPMNSEWWRDWQACEVLMMHTLPRVFVAHTQSLDADKGLDK